MKKKINYQLVGLAFVAIIATVLSVTLAYYSIFQKQIRSDLKTSADLLRDTRFFESLDVNVDDIDLSTDLENLRVTWIDTDGTVLYDNDTSASTLTNHKDRPEVQDAFETGVGESVRKSDTMNMNTFYYAVLLDNGTVLRVATEARSLQSVLISALPVILIIVVVIVIICVMLSQMLTRQLITPIEEMAEHLEDTSVTPPYKELVPFATTIRMQHEDILASARYRQDFTANVSHELKTPLTAISGYAELIENHMVDQEGQEHFAHEIHKNSERLLSLINDIIRLSDLDQSQPETGFENLNLNQVVGDSIEMLRMNAAQREITLTYSGEDCQIFGNPEMIRELVDNLVQNAIRYNNEGGYVDVKVQGGDSPCLVVKDNGIGIPVSDQERIFERFYRVDKSRSKATGGTGLGLAIVKHIVELHNGKIILDSTLNKGTEIRILF